MNNLNTDINNTSHDENMGIDNNLVNKHSPIWLEETGINEIKFYDAYQAKHPLYHVGDVFYDLNGNVSEDEIKSEICEIISPYITRNIMSIVNRLYWVMKNHHHKKTLPIIEDRIQFRNGAYYIDKGFVPNERIICLNPLPIDYNPEAPIPELWINFLHTLFFDEDIPCFQEFWGNMLVPHTKAQAMLMAIGNGGEGKSVLKPVLLSILGDNMTSEKFHKIETDRFALASLSGKLLALDEEMMLGELPSTEVIKEIVTAQGSMGIERKNIQRYQGRIYSRLMGFGNGPLRALCDDSEGFYRRQLIMKVRPVKKNRIKDPDLGKKLVAEREGILLWCLEGLLRLKANGWDYSISARMEKNRNEIREMDNNVIGFLNSTGYIRFDKDEHIRTKKLFDIYVNWCKENAEKSEGIEKFGTYLHKNEEKWGIRYSDKILENGKFYRGYYGICEDLNEHSIN